MRPFLDHFKEISNNYEVFGFSLGALGGGDSSLNALSVRCLEELAEKGKTVVIFSNTPMRRTQTMHWLAQNGIAPSLYQHVITSGEETWRHLKERHDPFHAALGTRCYFIGSPDAMELLDDLPISRVSNIEQAEFILAMDLGEWEEDVQSFKRLLSQGAAANIPMVCGCPDLFHIIEGKRREQAGALAKFYERLGGVVYYHGKPLGEFYLNLKRKIAPVSLDQVMLVGESIATDAKGAGTFKIPQTLILSPRVYEEIAGQTEKSFAKDQILSKLGIMNIHPAFLMDKLTW